jgi:charged multivesicular body protein 4
MLYREEIRENMQLNKEISEAIANVNPVDATEEDELEEMLADLEQEALDTKMISAPSVPVSIQGQAVRPGELWCLVQSLRIVC